MEGGQASAGTCDCFCGRLDPATLMPLVVQDINQIQRLGSTLSELKQRATNNEQLRASHIVAWSGDEDLRGDVNNGLLLSVPLDSLFDRGLISFDDTGQLIASRKLDLDAAKHFGVQSGLGIAWDHLREDEQQALRANLARHRQQHKDWEST